MENKVFKPCAYKFSTLLSLELSSHKHCWVVPTRHRTVGNFTDYRLHRTCVCLCSDVFENVCKLARLSCQFSSHIPLFLGRPTSPLSLTFPPLPSPSPTYRHDALSLLVQLVGDALVVLVVGGRLLGVELLVLRLPELVLPLVVPQFRQGALQRPAESNRRRLDHVNEYWRILSTLYPSKYLVSKF